MSKEMILIILGLLVAVLSQLGFPDGIKVVLYALAGLAVAIIGFLERGQALSRENRASESRPAESSLPQSELSE